MTRPDSVIQLFLWDLGRVLLETPSARSSKVHSNNIAEWLSEFSLFPSFRFRFVLRFARSNTLTFREVLVI